MAAFECLSAWISFCDIPPEKLASSPLFAGAFDALDHPSFFEVATDVVGVFTKVRLSGPAVCSPHRAGGAAHHVAPVCGVRFREPPAIEPRQEWTQHRVDGVESPRHRAGVASMRGASET